jgi:hypothetical protein
MWESWSPYISPIWIPHHYDVTDSLIVSIRFKDKCSVFIPQMVLAVGTKWFHKNLLLMLCTGTWNKIFTSLSVLSFRSVQA